MTWRPLYSPHLGQARWESLRSPQLGQAFELVGTRKSWLRRLAVRCFEWRRFGLGIAIPLQIVPDARAPAGALRLRIRTFAASTPGIVKIPTLVFEAAGQIAQCAPARVSGSRRFGTVTASGI